jgi:hypothetical protein
MLSFNFRIGTKLGSAAGISILLVGGILTNQMLGDPTVPSRPRPKP